MKTCATAACALQPPQLKDLQQGFSGRRRFAHHARICVCHLMLSVADQMHMQPPISFV